MFNWHGRHTPLSPLMFHYANYLILVITGFIKTLYTSRTCLLMYDEICKSNIIGWHSSLKLQGMSKNESTGCSRGDWSPSVTRAISLSHCWWLVTLSWVMNATCGYQHRKRASRDGEYIYSYTMGTSALPDILALAQGPQARGQVCIYQPKLICSTLRCRLIQ